MKILFIGGDKRMSYAADTLSAMHDVQRLGLGDYPLPEGKFGAVVLPLPLNKEPIDFNAITRYADNHTVVLAGGENSALTDICARNGFPLVNYFADETLTLKNAALTAEAACTLLAQSTEGALLGSKTLITGYGRIARLLAYRLAANGSVVTIAARRAEQRTAAVLDGFSSIPTEEIADALTDVDFIANTVPFALFTENALAKAKSGAVFIELATLPDQPSKPLAESRGINYIYAPGLPGKHSPKAAGEAIAETIQEIISRI
ncbi:MAG: NAD(P)-binding domain-containing protein [Oscillospiraceae bacterium]|nr:NAD(P)-binding domain-containing protein [Oscillospiraceae bacterium]